jgi:hypothetical protein
MNKDFPLLKMLVLVLVIALSHMAQANKKGYWTWTDDNGDPQYSDRPPEGVEAVFIEKNTTNSATSSPYESSSAKSEGEGEGEEQSGGPKTMEGLAAKDPEICRQAKNNLAGLKSARVRITEPDGSQHYLTEEEKAAQRERNQRLIDLNC